jgi:hypothetical protein
MPNDFQAALAEMIDANTSMVDALAQVAAKSALSAETVKQIVNGEKGPSQAEIDAVRAVLKVKPGKNPKASKPVTPSGGKSVTITLDGFAEHKTKPFAIFTADAEAGPRKYTQEDLQTIADNFNGGIKAAHNEDLKNPLVIGHEEDQQILKRSDLPAAGWIESVHVDGNRLMGVANRVPDTVRSWIDAGSYRNWSAEIYRDYKGSGPTLRRVALLGADIPHKKDLGEMAWENNSEDLPFDTFTGTPTMSDSIDKNAEPMPQAPAAPAAAAPQGEQVEIKGTMTKQQAAAAPAAAPAAPAAGPPMPQRFSELEQELKDVKELLTIERKRREDVVREKREGEIVKFAEDKAKEGYWTGDTTTQVIEALKKCYGVEKFAEGETTTDVVMKLLADVATKQTVASAPLSANAATADTDEDTMLRNDYSEYCKLAPSPMSIEKFAEYNGYDLPEAK